MTSQVTAYWASHLGCPADALFVAPWLLVTHRAELADYNGIFALLRGGSAIVSIPSELADSLRALLAAHSSASPVILAAAFRSLGFTVVGPAFIGYADPVRPPLHPARSLAPDDAPAVTALETACDGVEWEHGGSSLEGSVASCVFAGGQLVTLAGYEVWGGAIAHLSVITHPAFRGQGFGRSAVAHVARRALSAGLIPQYRTLESNLASIRVAESLGFGHYATSVAVRLNREA